MLGSPKGPVNRRRRFRDRPLRYASRRAQLVIEIRETARGERAQCGQTPRGDQHATRIGGSTQNQQTAAVSRDPCHALQSTPDLRPHATINRVDDEESATIVGEVVLWPWSNARRRSRALWTSRALAGRVAHPTVLCRSQAPAGRPRKGRASTSPDPGAPTTATASPLRTTTDTPTSAWITSEQPGTPATKCFATDERATTASSEYRSSSIGER